MLKQQINESLRYLQSLGPQKIWRLISELGMERLNHLSRSIENQDKILAIYQDCDFERVLQLMKRQTNEEIILYMQLLPVSEILFLLQHLSDEEILSWNKKVPFQETLKIIQKIGARHAFYLLSHLGFSKTVGFWQAIKTEAVLELISEIGARDAARLGEMVTIKDAKSWIKQQGIKTTVFYYRFLGVDNLIYYYQTLGIKKIFALLSAFSHPELALLIFSVRKRKFPTMPKHEKELQEWLATLLVNEPAKPKKVNKSSQRKSAPNATKKK